MQSEPSQFILCLISGSDAHNEKASCSANHNMQTVLLLFQCLNKSRTSQRLTGWERRTLDWSEPGSVQSYK